MPVVVAPFPLIAGCLGGDVGAAASLRFRIDLVAGQATAIRIRAGMMAQMISTVMFSWKYSALWPTDLR